MTRSIAVLLVMSLMFCANATAQECFPQCRDGFLCHQGKCIEACNPPCNQGSHCTADGQCVVDTVAPTKTIKEAPATPIPTDKITTFGIGPTLGEFYGGIAELEFDYRNVALQIESGAGINDDGNGCFYAGVAAGKRTFYDYMGSTRWTLFMGGYAGYLSEDGDYQYIIAGGKLMTGYTTFSDSGNSWGVDVGLKLGYRAQNSKDEYGDDYSGVTGGLEARYRFGF